MVTCLPTDLGVTSLILTSTHTLMGIDYEIITLVILLPSADLRRITVSYKRKYVHEVLVNPQACPGKRMVTSSDRSDMTIAVN